MSLHINKGRTITQCLHNRIDYAMNPDKTNNMNLVSSYGCDPKTVEGEFLLSKRQYQSLNGRSQQSNVIAYQVRQSFKPGEVTPEDANKIGYEFASRFLKGRHAFIVSTHIDKAHIHNHIIWNSTSLDEKRKFRNFFYSTFAVRRLSDQICMEHQLSVIENPKSHGQSYNVWLGNQKPPTHRDQIRQAIDQALDQNPKSFDELLSILRAAGCEIKPRKNPSIRTDGSHRFARFDTLGDGYSAEDLRSVIAEKKNRPDRKAPQQKAKGVDLLVDIQEKMRQGKGAGYEQWAKSFNLKQMSQTMIYLQKHNLLNYEDLKNKSADASSRFNELSAQIKSAESRIAEISALRSHIINYTKTRDVYIAYRKSGYSKKFLAEHESEILLHKAAKNHFNEVGITKLPSVKSLNTEYSELLLQKRKCYSEYRQARDDMRELLTVKANVDRILGLPAHPAPDQSVSQKRAAIE